jgi:hypothetical protein
VDISLSCALALGKVLGGADEMSRAILRGLSSQLEEVEQDGKLVLNARLKA